MPASAQRIQDLRAAGLSHKEIAAQMGCNQSSISRVLSRPLQQPIGCYRNKGGRPKKASGTSHRALRHIAITKGGNPRGRWLKGGMSSCRSLFRGPQHTGGCAQWLSQAAYPAQGLLVNILHPCMAAAAALKCSRSYIE